MKFQRTTLELLPPPVDTLQAKNLNTNGTERGMNDETGEIWLQLDLFS